MFVHHVAQNWPFTVRGRLCATRWWSCVLFRPQNISVDEFKPSSGRHFFLTHMHAGTCIISNNIETLFLFRSRVVLSLACRSFNWTAWRVGAWDDLLFLHNASSVTEAIQNPRIKCGKMSNSILSALWNLLVQYVTLTKPGSKNLYTHADGARNGSNHPPQFSLYSVNQRNGCGNFIGRQPLSWGCDVSIPVAIAGARSTHGGLQVQLVYISPMIF